MTTQRPDRALQVVEKRSQGIDTAIEFRRFVLDLARRAADLSVSPSVMSRIPSAIRRAIEEETRYGHGFLFTPVYLASGAFCWFSLADPPGLAILALLLCVLGMAAFHLRYLPGLWSQVARGGALVALGMLLAGLETTRLGTVILDAAVTTTVTGVVTARETTDRGYWRYRVALTGTGDPHLSRPPGTVTLLSRSRAPPIAIGETIEGTARLSPPSGPALAGLNDFGFDSYFRGIGAVGYFYGAPRSAEGTVTPDGNAVSMVLGPVAQMIAQWRERIGARIRTTIGGDAGAIAAALITAEERAISPDTVEALRQAGLAHVLAISGLNMVLAAGTLLVGARTALSLVPGLAHRFPIKKLAAAGALVMVFAYILISGGAVSAVRSWIMISIMLIAVFFDRPSISLRNVALSAIVILAVTPSAVTGPGFQMSFAATLALVAGYARWRDQPPGDMQAGPLRGLWSAVRIFFAGLLISSLIGGLSTMIYSVGHFHRIAAYGLLGNMLAMPIISIVVMPFALLAMILMPFGLDAYPLWIMGQGLEWMMAVAKSVSSWGGEVTVGRLPASAFLLIAAGGVLACLLRSWLAVLPLLLIVAGLGTALAFPVARPDLVVSEDGRMVALIAGMSAATNRSKPPDFIFSQWQRALVLKRHVKPLSRNDLSVADAGKRGSGPTEPPLAANARAAKPPIDTAKAREAMRRLFTETPAGRFACVARQWCGGNAHALRIALVEDARFIGAACDEADLVVTPVMLRIRSCRSGARLFTGRTLRRTGALEIFVDEPEVVNAKPTPAIRVVPAVENITRPWEIHRTYDWRTRRFDAVETDSEPAPTE